jgi:hypothetical protein
MNNYLRKLLPNIKGLIDKLYPPTQKMEASSEDSTVDVEACDPEDTIPPPVAKEQELKAAKTISRNDVPASPCCPYCEKSMILQNGGSSLTERGSLVYFAYYICIPCDQTCIVIQPSLASGKVYSFWTDLTRQAETSARLEKLSKTLEYIKRVDTERSSFKNMKD